MLLTLQIDRFVNINIKVTLDILSSVVKWYRISEIYIKTGEFRHTSLKCFLYSINVNTSCVMFRSLLLLL